MAIPLAAIRDVRQRRRKIAQRRQHRAQALTLPAPFGGWNTRDPPDQMPVEDAVALDNFWPGLGKVSLRMGRAQHVVGVGSGNVDFGMEYQAGTTRKMLAAGGGKIYDATSSAVSVLGSGYSEDRWQAVNFNGSMGLVNGTDAPQVYDGSSISAMSFTASGLTTTNIIGINAFQSRTYFWEDDSQDFWYSGVNTLGGSLAKFPLSRVGQFGGNLVAMGTWAVEGGADFWGGGGIGEDLAVFIMSSGDTIVYQGSDPGTASDWALMGVYRIGAPVDIRGVVRIGGDLLVLCAEGLVSMSALVRQGRLRDKDVISDKIRPTVATAAADYKSNTGWQAIYYPAKNMGLLNIPVDATTYHQYVVNARTGAWARFLGQNARAWWVYADELYFGGTDGTISKADTTNADAGANIQGLAETAYSYLKKPGVLKQITAIRPALASSGQIPMAITPQADFQRQAIPSSNYTFGVAPGASWENIEEIWEDWDSTSWEGDPTETTVEWLAAAAVGYAIGTKLRVDTSSDMEWYSTTYQMTGARGML